MVTAESLQEQKEENVQLRPEEGNVFLLKSEFAGGVLPDRTVPHSFTETTEVINPERIREPDWSDLIHKNTVPASTKSNMEERGLSSRH